VGLAERRGRWANVIGPGLTTKSSRHSNGWRDERSHCEYDQQGEKYCSVEGGPKRATFRPKAIGLDELRGREEEFERGKGFNSVTTVQEEGP